MSRQADSAGLRRAVARCAVVALAALPLGARADIPVGQQLPFFQGTDLTGTIRESPELRGPPTTVLVVGTSRAASDAGKAWVYEIQERYGERVQIINLIAIDLPFFISESTALDMARGQVPRRYWEQTWLSSEDSIQEALGLQPGSPVPYVAVVNRQGQLIASAHAPLQAPEAQQIWQALPPPAATLPQGDTKDP